jgi:hypothetical protein
MCPQIRFRDEHIANHNRTIFPGLMALLRMAVNDGQANRPRYVGRTSGTANSLRLTSFEQFEQNHLASNPNWRVASRERTIQQLRTMQERINIILASPESYIDPYVHDLVFPSSYRGHRIEQEILRAEGNGNYTPPSAEDESRNIDGYIDGVSYSVKPDSWFNDDRNGPTQLGDDLTRVISYSYSIVDQDIIVDYVFVRN